MSAEALIDQIRRANFVYICGNGGSATTAEHFSNDLFKKGIKAVCLNSNTSVITMIANDYGYEQIFGRQLATYAGKRDLLVTISCSGKSPNIVYAQKTARKMGMGLYAFEPFGKETDYGLLEDKHLRMVHEVTRHI